MNRTGLARTIAAALCLCAILLSPGSAVADPPQDKGKPSAPIAVPDEPGDLLSQLDGIWNVRQRMWTAPDSEPVILPVAIAYRKFVGDAYVEEQMKLAVGVDGDPFTRSAAVSWNVVNQTYEYFSIDSRLPQMMMYPTATEDADSVWFTLREPFVATAWGEDSDVPFAARLELRPGADRQVVRLYLKQLSAQPTKEFVAFEYIYTRAG